MPSISSQRRRIAPSLLSLTLIATATVAIPCAPASAVKPVRVVKRFQRNSRALVEGALVEGPKHSWDAIRQKPVRYAVMLAGVGAVGGGAKLVGINPEGFMLALSVGTLAYSIKQSWPALTAANGLRRMRAIGRELVWPSALSVGTSGIGVAAGHAHRAHATANLADAAVSGVQSILIGGDVPTIAQTALEKRAKKPD